ncbi:MAG: hypothetical protein H7263_18565 [Candidatus Sericytochromatia bacterium]|nr:hypothetical protein [Candidatus Sericytochromatia bacterium]
MDKLPIDYAKTLLELKQKINQSKYESLKAVNKELILMYLDIGKVISEKIKVGWGSSVIDTLSKDLQSYYPGLKGFSSRNLYRMKLIFEEIANFSISPQLVAKLPWGHSDLIFSKINNTEQRLFYIQRCIERGWSRGILEEEIKT